LTVCCFSINQIKTISSVYVWCPQKNTILVSFQMIFNNLTYSWAMPQVPVQAQWQGSYKYIDR
jgi:hypothetical protein